MTPDLKVNSALIEFESIELNVHLTFVMIVESSESQSKSLTSVGKVI